MNKENFTIRKSVLAGIFLVLIAAIVLEATSLVQYYYSQMKIREEASLRAEAQLENTKIQISDVLDQAEAAVRNNLWVARWSINHRDSMIRVTERLLENNPVVMGSSIAFVPGYFKDKPLMAPYSYKDSKTGEIKNRSLATDEYDYPSQEWFTKAIKNEFGHWSEPYLDVGGGEIMMTTFSMPIKDLNGKVAGVLTADISLDWLTDMFGGVQMYPNAFSVMASREGKLMVCPVTAFVMKKTIQEVTLSLGDSIPMKDLSSQILSGKTGNIQVRPKDDTYYVYYAPVERTGWSMSIVIPKDEIFGEMRKVAWLVRLLQVIGLLMLFFILRGVARNQMKLKAVSDKKEKLESELRIASGIQMSMIPKTYPPFPDRKDIDMAGLIVPAKEVGGDLYDFYLRDEKLFFCIGDVSGKGVPASLVMAMTRSLFRTVSAHEVSPARIISSMNSSMSDMNENNMFVTFFCGVLNMTTGSLRYCNAGHNAPVILKNTIAELPVKPNLPLGIINDMKYHDQEIELDYDDALLLYTDGLTEAENIHHELFGLKRVFGVLHERRDAMTHLETMNKVVNDFVNGAPQSDDLTMLFIHYLGSGKHGNLVRHLSLKNEIDQIRRLSGFMDGIAEDMDLSQSLSTSLHLALEEAASNVIMYAYPKGTEGFLTIDAVAVDDSIEFTFKDSGVAFDPTAVPPTDTTLGFDERKIGGLGIHLVKNIMDTVVYERRNGKNILKMTKKIR